MSPPESRRVLWALAAVLGAALALRMMVAYLMPNVLWPDEIFQTLEPAHRAVFGPGLVAWEYHVGLRSWVLPGLLAGVMKAASWVTSSTTGYLMACAGAMSVISLAPVWAAFRAAGARHGLRGAVVAAAFVATWFELVYFGPKALFEAVAGNCLALGVVLCDELARGAPGARGDGPAPGRARVVASVALLALAAMLRIHLAPAAFLVFAYTWLRLPRAARGWALLAGAAVVLAVGLLDAVTWRYPFQSFVENIRINILQGKSRLYGVAPWDAYFGVFARIWGPWGLAVLALAALGARRAPLIAAAAVVALAVHLPIAHKEYRFAYPAMVLVVVLAGQGAAALLAWLEARSAPRIANLGALLLVAAWLSASLAGANGFHGRKTQLAEAYKVEEPHWSRRRGGLVAMQLLGEAPDVCGLMLAGVGWADTGGYTYLHRDVPIFLARDQRNLAELTDVANALFTRPHKPEHIGPFTRIACWDDLCAYRRPGGCAKVEGYDLNALFRLAESRPPRLLLPYPFSLGPPSQDDLPPASP